MIPLYDGHLRMGVSALAAKLPVSVLQYYDPSRDHEFNMMMLAALSGYAVMSLGICGFLDLFPGSMARFKVQGDKNFFSIFDWACTVSMVAANLFIFSWLATLPAWHMQRTGLVRACPVDQRRSANSPPLSLPLGS